MKKNFAIDDQKKEVEIKNLGKDQVQFEMDGESFNFELIKKQNDFLILKEVKNENLFRVCASNCQQSQKKWHLLVDGEESFVSEMTQTKAKESDADSDGLLTSPMPGKIFQINVREGDKVERGDALLILEAMKMEHTLKAPCDGLVKNVLIKLHQQVDAGASLLEIEK